METAVIAVRLIQKPTLEKSTTEKTLFEISGTYDIMDGCKIDLQNLTAGSDAKLLSKPVRKNGSHNIVQRHAYS